MSVKMYKREVCTAPHVEGMLSLSVIWQYMCTFKSLILLILLLKKRITM